MIDDQPVKRENTTHKGRAHQGENRPAWLVFVLALIGLIYLLNPTGGLIELIPDNLPLVGNLDEGVAAVLVWQGISRLRSSFGKKSKAKAE